MKAFTLIEIVIAMLVVSIIGIIAAPKLMDIAREARIKNEASALGGIRTGIDLVQLENRTRNISPAYPAHLDSATTAPASGSNPLFGNVLRTAITSAWEKTGEDRYKGPTGQEYEYDPENGLFTIASSLPPAETGYYTLNSLNNTYNYSANPAASNVITLPLADGGNNTHVVFRFSNGDLGVIPGLPADLFVYRYSSNGRLISRSSSKMTGAGYSMVEAADGSIITADASQKLYKVYRDGRTEVFYDASRGKGVENIAQMPNGNIAVLNYTDNSISEISSATGKFIGDLTQASATTLRRISFGPDNTIYATSDSGILKGTVGGSLTPIASVTPTYGIAALPNGEVLAALSGRTIQRYGPNGEDRGAALTNQTNRAIGLYLSTNGSVYTANMGDDWVGKVTELSFPNK